MGQSANNGGRNASLDERKLREAGRLNNPGPDRDFDSPFIGRGRTKGAFGHDLQAQSKTKPRKARSDGGK